MALPVNRITNSDIHHFASENGVKLYEIADHLEVDDVTFFKSLGQELPLDRKHEIVQAIQDIKEHHDAERNSSEA